MIKIAALCSWLQGLGFGLPCLYGIWSLVNRKSIAYFMRFPTYGYGPFEKIGVQTTTPLLTGFLFVCVLECLAGWGIWNGDKGIAILSMVIIPVELMFYIGFALPFGPPVLLARIILLWLSWSLLH